MFAIGFTNIHGKESCVIIPSGTGPEEFRVGNGKIAIWSREYAGNGDGGWRLIGATPGGYKVEVKMEGAPSVVHDAALMLNASGQYFVAEELKELSLLPGQFHPRIWRGRYRISRPLLGFEVDSRRLYQDVYHQSVVAADSLFAATKETFRYVEPTAANLQTYGHRLRELLILLCTEVEAIWRGVLVANDPGYASKQRLTTKDYHRLAAPMRLSSWDVRLADYPALGLFRPFEDWDAKAPTGSLSWYQAYNSVKHDREASFAQATLGHVLDAAAALHILQAAQWGPSTYDRLGHGYASIFHTVGVPKFSMSDLYFPAVPARLNLSVESGPVPLPK